MSRNLVCIPLKEMTKAENLNLHRARYIARLCGLNYKIRLAQKESKKHSWLSDNTILINRKVFINTDFKNLKGKIFALELLISGISNDDSSYKKNWESAIKNIGR